ILTLLYPNFAHILDAFALGKESVLQESVCSTENGQENNQKVFSAENGDNQHQSSYIAVDDPSKILIEDPPHRQPLYDTTSSANLDRNTQNMETTTNPNLDMNEVGMERIIESNVDINIEEMEATTEPDINNKEIVSTNSVMDINIWEIESVGEIPLEAISLFDRQFIAGLISHSETVEDIKFLRDESGLTKEKLQLGWNLLPSEEKERLRPLFAQLNQPEPDPFPIGQKIKARLQHFTGQWMRLIGEVVEFLTDSGDIHKQLRTADGWEYPLSCLNDIQPLSWEERMGLS
ncbi:hypothetical protein P9B04_03410, partial [Crocosphaera sp. Alani8]